ncbi:hypothetical protein D3C81_929860 [compost metagenome]
MDHRGLRERRQQFVRGLGGEDDGVLLARLALGHAVVVLVERMERRIRVPGFVEMQEVHSGAEVVGNLLGVVAKAVVGGVGDHGDARFCARLGRLAGQRIGLDHLLQCVAGELVKTDRPDDAVRIAAGGEVHRNAAGHDQRVQQRLVAVAVHEHDVAARHGAVPDDLVGGGGAVGDEECVVGAEVAGGFGFSLADRAGVIEQRAQFRHRDGEIAAQRVLAIELMQRSADR